VTVKPTQDLALGIDIGGTFTDVVVAGPAGVLTVVKHLTTPGDPARAATEGAASALERAGVTADQISRVVHGTTLATNTILERHDIPVAFVTTRGFRDVLQLGRHARVEEERFDLLFEPPVPPVQATLTFEVTERVGAAGEVVVALDEAEVIALAEHLATLAISSVAVCLLHAHTNPAHEQRIGELLRARLGVDVVLSCEIWPEVREYERATTTVMSAFVGPVMSTYLAELGRRLQSIGVRAPLYVMESAGGVMSVDMARRRAVATIESGPAAGVIAAQVVGADHGHRDVIAFDMGGTTAKAAVIRNGEADVTHQFQVGGKGSFGTRRSGTGIPIKTPTIDLAEVGAGGGSIAWVDEAGALHVGPRSAGADPGPACYGLGGVQPTVTDASVVLGYLDPRGFGGGAFRFDGHRSAEAIEKLIARPLDVSPERAAAAIHEIATATMAGAIHVVTVQRGVDPRRCVLVTSGGAGPLHASRIADRFGITTVIVPPACGVASALGLLASDLRADRVRTLQLAAEQLQPDRIAAAFAKIEALTAADVSEVAPRDTVVLQRAVDMRYRGQSHELAVPVPAGPLDEQSLAALRQDFYARHRQAFGVAPDRPVELVNIRVRATRAVAHAAFRRPSEGGVPAAPTSRPAWFTERNGFVDTPVHRLDHGTTCAGPALLEAPEATVLVPPGWAAQVDDSGAAVLRRRDGAGAAATWSDAGPTPSDHVEEPRV
jgi:N-methylhydantoinase A